MNSRRLCVALSVLAVAALILAACGQAATPTPETIVETVEVPVVETVGVPVTAEPFDCTGHTMAHLGFGHQFAFIAIVDDSMQAVAAERGVNLIFLDNEFSPDKALENAEIIAARGDVELVFEMNYWQQQNYVIAEIFRDAGIPVIALDTPVPGATYYGGDNYTAGKLAGQALGQYAIDNWGGDVGLVLVEQQNIAGQQALEARTLGIIAGIHESLPSLPDDLIVRFEGGVNVDEAREAVVAQLDAHPEAGHILIGMLGDSNGVAAAIAAEEAGYVETTRVTGMGGDTVAIEALRSGDPPNFLGSTTWRPENYGNDLITLGCRILAGEQVPAMVFVPHVFITSENLSEYYPE